ncbi:protein kinase [Bacteroidota bacterium]
MINDRYKILKKIGEGRSKVFLCSDSLNDGIEMALKILPSNADENEIAGFKEEFLTIRGLKHPNIVQVGEYETVVELDETDKGKGIEEGSKFFTLEYIDGRNLADSYESVDENILLDIISQLCHVLYFIHSSNYIYYDLKFENILVIDDSGRPQVKLIDFGLTRNINNLKDNLKSGTAEYIAPEILSEDAIDHRIDFYSLGIILYKIIYGKFPVSGKAEIEIFKQHLEWEFEFGKSEYSNKIVDVVKRLLIKNPADRYTTALEICADLEIPLNKAIFSAWNPAQVFVVNSVVLSIKSYLSSIESEDVLVIKGPEGSGKTHTAEEIYFHFENVILIQSNNPVSGIPLWNIILRRIFYSDFIYPNLSNAVKGQFEKVLKGEYENLLEELRAIFVYLSNKHEFVLLLDDFDKYDNLTSELLGEIIPILLVNKIKVIITESPEDNFNTSQIASRDELQIIPFTELELQSFLERTFSANFPLTELNKKIFKYSDLFPGMVVNFLRTLFYLEMLNIQPDRISLELSKQKLKFLKSSHDDIYEIRLGRLTEDELLAAQTIAMVNVDLPRSTLALLCSKNEEEISDIISSLQKNNILKKTISAENSFTSNGLKQYVYRSITDKKQRHLKIAEVFDREIYDFNNEEIARHYELAEEYGLTYQTLLKEFDSAEKISAHSYQKKMLVHLLELPLYGESEKLTKYKLSQTLYKLKNNSEALKLTNELLEQNIEEERKKSLLLQKGGCLVRLGEYARGLETYNKLLPELTDPKSRNELSAEIAVAEVYLNELDKAREICNEILDSKDKIPQLAAKCLNLLGFIEFKQSGNLDGAIKYFKEALIISENHSMKMTETETERNIGNIYSIKGNYDKAEHHWKNALVKNSSIGSLSLEATLLMNYGILNYNKLELEKSVEINKKAAAIFKSLGDKTNYGGILSNLGEVYQRGCEYDNAANMLYKAIVIFEELDDKIEILENYLLLGKLFYYLNDIDGLRDILDNYSLIMNSEYFQAGQKRNFEFLNHLLLSITDDKKVSSECLNKLRDEYLEANDSEQYAQTNFLFIKHLINVESFEEAVTELEEDRFKNQIQNKPFYESERTYLLSVISSQVKERNLKPQLDYLESAYEIIKEKSITELTWMILSDLAEAYMDRGFIKKANGFIILCKSLIDHIVLNIKDVKQRNQYLANKERKSSIEKLDLWANYIK